jgi:hypothetical protein
MTNPHLRVKNDWTSYKFHAKEMIYRFTNDIVYRDEKLKRGSLFKLFLGNLSTKGLTTDFEYVTKPDPHLLYLSDNNFK